MKVSVIHLIGAIVFGLVIGTLIGKRTREGFNTGGGRISPQCQGCGQLSPCECPKPRPVCPPCREPDMSKYVLKSSIPPCPTCPDMSSYMLKTECPPVPDLSKYVLKSSIPKQQPVILDCSKCKKPSGDCPPCPRPRCPEVKCPEPTKCAPCAPCARQSCPPAVVKCRAEEVPHSTVRPYLAPLSFSGFGLG